MCKKNEVLPAVCPEEGTVIGYGATSTVYLLPDGTVCKVFNSGFSPEEIRRESNMAENACRLGICVPRPYGLVSAGGGLGIRSEYIAGESLASLLKKEPGRYEELLLRYLAELRRFHETDSGAADFVCAKTLYLEKIKRLSGSRWYTERELEKMEKLVRSVPDRHTLVYGDYHPKNILVKEGRLFFVDLGDACFGHPVFDFAMIANTHFIIPSVNPAYAEEFFTVSPQLMLRLWGDLFARYFSAYTADEQNRIRKGIMAFAILRQGLSPADGRAFPEKVLQANVAIARRKLLERPETENILIDW